MKKYIILLFLIGLFSCNDDFLNKSPLDQETSQSFSLHTKIVEPMLGNFMPGIQAMGWILIYCMILILTMDSEDITMVKTVMHGIR